VLVVAAAAALQGDLLQRVGGEAERLGGGVFRLRHGTEGWFGLLGLRGGAGGGLIAGD
jgi:hypothetical protein